MYKQSARKMLIKLTPDEHGLKEGGGERGVDPKYTLFMEKTKKNREKS